MVKYKLDREVKFDEKSRSYPVSATIVQTEPRSYTWRCDAWLDQGVEGACAGFSVSHEASARPRKKPNLTEADAFAVYKRAQQIDEWAGEDYEGTSVLAAIKAGKERGWFTEYRWAFGVHDLALAVSRKGPAVIGVNWYEGMWEVDSKGFISATGQAVGGHAILCNGYNVKGRYFKLHNSWGKDWGVKGGCKISYDDMHKLLKEQGEACIPTKSKTSK